VCRKRPYTEARSAERTAEVAQRSSVAYISTSLGAVTCRARDSLDIFSRAKPKLVQRACGAQKMAITNVADQLRPGLWSLSDQPFGVYNAASLRRDVVRAALTFVSEGATGGIRRLPCTWSEASFGAQG
jgi:hypothetical protein